MRYVLVCLANVCCCHGREPFLMFGVESPGLNVGEGILCLSRLNVVLSDGGIDDSGPSLCLEATHGSYTQFLQTLSGVEYNGIE